MQLSSFLGLALVFGSPSAPTTAANPNPTCPSRNVPLEGRKSPLDSLSFTINEKPVKVCYGRPSARGRAMLGGQIPYGKLWRTGANEPTIIFVPIQLHVAGIKVAEGVYSLYTVPGPREWEIILNRSISQWGHENDYTEKVKAQELGRARVRSEALETPVETFTIRAEPAGDEASLLLEWEKTRVRIPVEVRR
ncbi:MAG: DUF2911 domain-containing protein [Gemmatimonadales bacterium]